MIRHICICCKRFNSDGNPHSTNSRLVLDNPGDMSTYLGYKDHGIHDMSSLVDEAQTKAHGQSGSGNDVAGAGSGIPYNTPSTKYQSTTMLLNTCSGSCENLIIDKKLFKNNLSKLIFITNTQQIILYVLKRTVSVRRRF